MNNRKAMLLVCMVAMVLLPELAYAQGGDPGAYMIDRIIAWLTGRVGRGCAVIAVIAVGMSYWDGRLKFGPAIAVVVGIVVVFSAAAIVDMAAAA